MRFVETITNRFENFTDVLQIFEFVYSENFVNSVQKFNKFGNHNEPSTEI
jgi:hypothetical protein